MHNREGRGYDLRSGERAERHHLASAGLYINLVQRSRIELKPRFNFKDNTVLAELGEDGRDLPLTKSIVKRVINRLRHDVESRGFVAVHINRELQALRLLVGGNVREHGGFAQFFE